MARAVDADEEHHDAANKQADHTLKQAQELVKKAGVAAHKE
jgi:hypothetical protein